MYIDKEKYKKLRKQRGLTANHLIAKTKTSRATYYKYVNGESEITSDFALLLANELVCPVGYLVI